MKRLGIILLLIITLVAASATIEAKSSRRSARTHATQTAKEYSPAGHIYKCRDHDITTTLKFNADNTAVMEVDYGPEYGGQIEATAFTWRIDDNKVYSVNMPGLFNGKPLQFSTNGRSLVVMDGPVKTVYKLIK